MTENQERDCQKPRVANLGIQTFYDALLSQGVDCVQVQWQPPARLSKEMEELLEKYL